ncbi:MAG TPA: hypothetical protein VFG69_19290 [Nannocystaceae bacterium]|nr:hypothetical protein [Nannocystaceae bacterium]
MLPARAWLRSTLFAGLGLACASDPPDADDRGSGGSTGGDASGATTGTTADDDGDGDGDATAASTSDPSGSTAADATSAGEADACPLPASVDAVIDPRWGLLPIVRVDDPDVVGVTIVQAATLDVRSLAGDPIWSADHGAGALFGGFDYDADGWPDLGLARHEDGVVPCGASFVGSSWITLVNGRDGGVAYDTAAEADICWTFPTTTYPTVQWGGGVLFGAGPMLFLSPYYATTATLSQWDGAALVSVELMYPSTAAYDSTYTADLPNAWGLGTSYLANSHVANGLVGTFAGETRAVFFTSGRVVQYADAAAAGDRLRADRPFLSAGRTDLAGRNYGLVARDPGAPERVVLLAGTSIATLYLDAVSGAMTSDPWGGIERHVSIYDTTTNAIVDRFFSTAHDAGDGHQFEGRVAYPHNPFVRTAAGPSRLAYSVYEGGHWVLHVSVPGDPADATTIRGIALFDIRDVDGDGIDEWIATRTELDGDPDVPGYYFPRWRADIYRWDEASLTLQLVVADESGLPVPLTAFRAPDRSSSAGSLYPAAVVDEGCIPALVLRTATGELVTTTLPGAAAPDGCTCSAQ